MSGRKEEILEYMKQKGFGMTASDIAEALDLERSNISRYLAELAKEGFLTRSEGRPVVYQLTQTSNGASLEEPGMISFTNLIGANESLKVSIQQAKAAILYPPRGLHTIIFGETGTGKSLFAECMYQFAIDSGSLPSNAPFVSFNCADYAQNPQLLFAQIFGVKKGAYTGANEDREGLVNEANGGILFLDEIHRLPPEGQEMLFTFIDKGTYRPLGESSLTKQASIQIIGATTENSETFLATFNRRIPMSITLPPLSQRSIDERYEIVTSFISQEATRLNQRINFESEAVLAFMLYDAEGNIGQVKRDLKLVCAKAFLHYRTQHEETLVVYQRDLPLQVQKGLLKMKEFADRIRRFEDFKNQYLSFDPSSNDVVWSKDPSTDMAVYNAIEEKVETLSAGELENVDLESLISSDVDTYFMSYVDELSRSPIHRDLIPEGIWHLTKTLYQAAEKRLGRKFTEQAQFAFALHLQGTIERIKENRTIIHPDLNNIRKKYSKEFQVAIDLSSTIEEELDIEIPFDEIGFITMFLTIDLGKQTIKVENKLTVILLMHGRSTATSMLEAVQELLGTEMGVAFNMPLTMEVSQMYEILKEYVIQNKDNLQGGILLLTDMGSLNTFGNMILEETGVRTKAISMVSTMVVLEAVRMASVGRSLEDTYQNVQMAFENILRGQFRSNVPLKKAVVVTCFTGEGVATHLYERIKPVVNQQKTEIIQMQFLEKDTFKKHIDELMQEYEIKAIVGTVDVEYQNIPFFSAFDIYKDETLQMFKRIVSEDIPIEEMITSLEGTLKGVHSVQKLVILLAKIISQIQNDLQIIVDPGVDAGIIIHMAFMMDAILQHKETRKFNGLDEFSKKHRIEMNVVRTNLMSLEKQYRLSIAGDEIAYLTQMFLENRINKKDENA